MVLNLLGDSPKFRPDKNILNPEVDKNKSLMVRKDILTLHLSYLLILNGKTYIAMSLQPTYSTSRRIFLAPI
jgi:hypothetical protein